jgi:hypothetical protein
VILRRRLAVEDVNRRAAESPRLQRLNRAASSTSGPREVLISQASGFISASSAAPISARMRPLRTR